MSEESQSASSRGIIAAIVVILLLGGGYFLYNRSQPKPMTVNTSPSPVAVSSDQTTASPDASASAKPGEQLTITLLEQNNSKQAGIATITEIGDKTQVQLRVAGTTGAEPAHIHIGSCPQPGAVKYPLTDVVGGVSETTLDVSLSALKSQFPLAINIHKSKTEIQAYVACGDLQ